MSEREPFLTDEHDMFRGMVRQFVEGAPDGPIPLHRSSDEYVESLLE